MFRKTFLSIAAFVAIGTAALIPTAASAGHHGGGHHGHHGGGLRVGLYSPTYLVDDGCYQAKRYVETRHGLKVRYVTVCD